MAIGTEVGRQSMEIRAGLDNFTQIKLVGVGGGGSNAVNRMIREDIRGVEFITVNTDAQALVRSVAPVRLRIGDKLTRGLGVGGDHKVGMLAAEESRNGMGGGTGTGAAAVVAEVAKEQGILTIGVVTKPFAFEGLHRARVAEEGIIRLRERADTIIVIPNERLLSTCDSNISIDAAFKVVDDVLLRSVQGISEVITLPGHINLDFNDVRTIMKDAGHSWIGIGHACGERRAVEAARAALESPLFDVAIERAKRILFNIVGNDLSLSEVNEAADVIRQVSHPYAQIIFGLGTDPDAGEEVKLTLIATDFSEPEPVIIEDDDELPELEFEDDKRRSFRPWSR
jgi:cell division protein FtsZ